MKNILLTLFIFIQINTFSQEQEIVKNDYLVFETGLIFNWTNSLGVRTFFEYQKETRKNWSFGVSYEHSQTIGSPFSGFYHGETNLSLLSLNSYYRINLIKDRLFWVVGAGIGAGHVHITDHENRRYNNGAQEHLFGYTFNISTNINVRISKRIYLQTSPLLVLPPFNRVYYSPNLSKNGINYLFAQTAFPIGIKIKL